MENSVRQGINSLMCGEDKEFVALLHGDFVGAGAKLLLLLLLLEGT